MIDQTIKFKDLFKIPTKNGLSKPSRVIGEGKKIIMMNEIFAQRRIRNANMKRVPVSETEIQSHGLKKGDLLFARTSLKFEGAGKCVIFEGDKETVVYESNLIRCRLDENKANAHFYFYYFNTYEGRKIIESILMETAATSMRGSDLSELRVPYFDISFQNIVAKILSSIEDKIELNQQMNETLEEIAKTLFKSWFIDFDPVRAKAEGRSTGLSKEISDLFPDSFEDSEIGEIPRGWKVYELGEILDRLPVGKRYSNKSSLKKGKIPIIDQSIDGIIGYHNNDDFIEASSDIPVMTFSNHTCNLRIVDFNFSTIQNVIPLKPKDLPILWTYIRSQGLQKFEEYRGHIPDFLIKEIPVPEKLLADNFESIVKPLYSKVFLNKKENKILTSLRDTLLPKLISGELKILDAENLVEEAGIECL